MIRITDDISLIIIIIIIIITTLLVIELLRANAENFSSNITVYTYIMYLSTLKKKSLVCCVLFS